MQSSEQRREESTGVGWEGQRAHERRQGLAIPALYTEIVIEIQIRPFA